MAFNISDFTSQIGKNGLARSNIFVVRLTALPATLSEEIPARDLVFFCKSVDLPSLNVQYTEHMAQGFGKKEYRPTGFDKSMIPAIFMLDSNHKILSFFHRWIQSTVNYDVSSGGLSEVNGALPYEIGYKSEYVASMEINFFSPNYENKYYTYKFEGVYPTEIGNVSLSWENNDEIATLPVNFAYDAVKVDGSMSGTVTGGLNRGAGLIEYINSLNSRVQTIQGISRPQSIQDIINQYSTITNLF